MVHYLYIYQEYVYDYTCDRDLVREIIHRNSISEKKKHQIILYKYETVKQIIRILSKYILYVVIRIILAKDINFKELKKFVHRS